MTSEFIKGDLTAKARAAGAKARTARANGRAADLAPIIANLLAGGTTSLHAIATALNERGIRTAWGRGLWTASQVRRVLGRLRGTVG
jgi:hypothetical protein